jgi:hypothetical protein
MEEACNGKCPLHSVRDVGRWREEEDTKGDLRRHVVHRSGVHEIQRLEGEAENRQLSMEALYGPPSGDLRKSCFSCDFDMRLEFEDVPERLSRNVIPLSMVEGSSLMSPWEDLNNPQVCEASRDETLERVRECFRHNFMVQNASMVVVLMVPTWMLWSRLVCIVRHVGMNAL